MTLFLAAAWLGSIPGFRMPLTAQSPGPAAVPRGKPIKPLVGEPKAEGKKGEAIQGDASKATMATNAPAAAALVPAAKPGFASVGFDVLAPSSTRCLKTLRLRKPTLRPRTRIPRFRRM